MFATHYPRSTSSPPHLCVLSELCVKFPTSFNSHFRTSPEISEKPRQKNSFQISALRTLPSSVSCKSFVCHSYENNRGVYQLFPFRNSALAARRSVPYSSSFVSYSSKLFCTRQNLNSFLFKRFRTLCQKHPGWGEGLRPFDVWTFRPSDVPTCFRAIHYPLSFQTLAHSFALFCTHQKLNSFLFKRFHTLCEKHPGWGEGSLFRFHRTLATEHQSRVTIHQSLPSPPPVLSSSATRDILL